MTVAYGGTDVNPTPTTEAGGRGEQEELARLLRRAEQGDRSVLPRLREALDADAKLWKDYGDLALQAEAALIQLAAGPNVLMAEALLRKLHALKGELAAESTSPLEQLLVQRVTATWLQAAYYDALAAQASGAGEARSRLLLQQQDAAHRRHLAAVKVLATVRRLLRPAVSPVQVASRLGGPGPAARRGGAAIAGTVPAGN